MSKGPWKKHEGIEEEILILLERLEIATANVVFYELRQLGHKISYSAVVRKLEALKKEEKVENLKGAGIGHKIWKIHNFLND